MKDYSVTLKFVVSVEEDDGLEEVASAASEYLRSVPTIDAQVKNLEGGCSEEVTLSL